MGKGELYRKTRGPCWRCPIVIKVVIVSLFLVILSGAVGRYAVNSWTGARGTTGSGRVAQPQVRLGIENLDAYMDVFKGKRVGLITNATGVDRQGEEHEWRWQMRPEVAAAIRYLGLTQ